MKSVILEKPGQFRTVQVDDPPSPGEDEVVVQVRRIGVCGTDLHAYKGNQPFFTYPRVLGHELAVEVLDVGEGVRDGISTGTFCAVEPYFYCGNCVACKKGRTNCCKKMVVMGVHEDGGMREKMLLPAAKLLPSQSLPLEHLALVEMLCIGAHAVRRAGIKQGDHVLVIGAGPIGLGTAAFTEIAGAKPVLLDINEHRLEFAKQFLPISHTLLSNQHVSSQLVEICAGELPDIVFDATGNQSSMQQAFTFTASAGKLVFIGIHQGRLSFDNPEFHRKELTLLSSRNATRSDFEYVLDNLEQGKINLTPWISRVADLDQVADEFPTWIDPKAGVVKAMVALD